MAGMFYSLEEVVEQLSITAEQVTQLVKDGKLKEFRDGDKVLFKVEQVQQLAAESEDVIELAVDEDELIPLEADDDESPAPLAIDDDEELAIDDVPSPATADEDELVSLASGAVFNVTTGVDDNMDGILTDRPEGVGRNSGESTDNIPAARTISDNVKNMAIGDNSIGDQRRSGRIINRHTALRPSISVFPGIVCLGAVI